MNCLVCKRSESSEKCSSEFSRAQEDTFTLSKLQSSTVKQKKAENLHIRSLNHRIVFLLYFCAAASRSFDC